MTSAARRAGPPVVRDEDGLARLRHLRVTRALTLWPEWLLAICKLDKRVENRPRPPFAGLVGTRIALHAGKHVGGRAAGFNEGMSAFIETAQHAGWMVEILEDRPGDAGVFSFIKGPASSPTRVVVDIPDSIVTSAIVATAKIGGYHKPTANPTIPWQAGSNMGDPESYSYAWILEDVEVLDRPIACPGAQGVWTL